eukprot:COSAG06_NODE_7195_length_2589_cov_1.346185_3_plen_300_part_00
MLPYAPFVPFVVRALHNLLHLFLAACLSHRNDFVVGCWTQRGTVGFVTWQRSGGRTRGVTSCAIGIAIGAVELKATGADPIAAAAPAAAASPPAAAARPAAASAVEVQSLHLPQNEAGDHSHHRPRTDRCRHYHTRQALRLPRGEAAGGEREHRERVKIITSRCCIHLSMRHGVGMLIMMIITHGSRSALLLELLPSSLLLELLASNPIIAPIIHNLCCRGRRRRCRLVGRDRRRHSLDELDSKSRASARNIGRMSSERRLLVHLNRCDTVAHERCQPVFRLSASSRQRCLRYSLWGGS